MISRNNKATVHGIRATMCAMKMTDVRSGFAEHSPRQIAYRGANTVEALGGDLPIFGDSLEPTHAAEVIPAKVDLLFVEPKIRCGSSQPMHFASDVDGFAQKPVVRHDINCSEVFTRVGTPAFQSSVNHVFVAAAPQNTGAQCVHRILCVDWRTGVASHVDVVPPEGVDMLGDEKTPKLFATKNGVALAWAAQEAHFVSRIDARSKSVMWSTELSKSALGTIDWVHETEAGDIFVLYGDERNGTSARAKGTRLCLLDKATGRPKIEREGPWPREEFGKFVSAANIDGASSAPLILHYDEANETAVIGLFGAGAPRAVHFFSINFKSCAIEKVGEIEVASNGFTASALAEAALFLPVPHSACGAVRVEFDKRLKPNVMPLSNPELVQGYSPLVSNGKGAVATSIVESSLSFFKIENNGKGPLQQIQQYFESLEITGLSSAHFTAMTRDGIVYHSSALGTENAERQHAYRLAAYDATTAKMLWSIYDFFKWQPAIMVNADGSGTWLDGERAVIFE